MKETEIIYGFEPHIRQNSAVLILGTLPGPQSLSKKKYYADPSNKFWDILFQVCGEKVDKTDKSKDELLEKYNIALWDILEQATRPTAEDKNLKDEKPSDLPRCLSEYPNIKLLVFHSGDSFKYFRRFYKNTTVPYIRVDSPSGNNRKSVDKKIIEWKAALSGVIPKIQAEHKLEWKKID